MENVKNALVGLDKKYALNSQTSEEKVTSLVDNHSPGGWPNHFHEWTNVQNSFIKRANKEKENILKKTYPKNRFSGKGVVVVGGGSKYFPSAYVNCRILRLLGCSLPIEFWYIGASEMDCRMKEIIQKNIGNIKLKNVYDYETVENLRIVAGWESKIYSALLCDFEEVLLLDSDNTCMHNPEFLFKDERYKKHGSILWPDYAIPKWSHDAEMWRMMGMEYREERQVESGQLLLNKAKCWHAINMAKHYADYSDYYFKIYYGDKEAFHFGWRFMGNDYEYPPQPDWINNSIIGQKYYDGSLLFSHRAQAKFKLDKSHPICLDMPLEEDTLELLDELNSFWDGHIWENNNPLKIEQEAQAFCSNKKYFYDRVGLDTRDISFGDNNEIKMGSARMEKKWFIFKEQDRYTMSILGDEGLTALLYCDDFRRNVWKGHWVDYERCEIVIRSYE